MWTRKRARGMFAAGEDTDYPRIQFGDFRQEIAMRLPNFVLPRGWPRRSERRAPQVTSSPLVRSGH